MNPKLKLVLFALSPFLVGIIIELSIKQFSFKSPLILLISLFFCGLWFAFGYHSVKLTNSLMEAIILGNCFILIAGGLIPLSSVIPEFYLVGLTVKFYYFLLPMIIIVGKIANATGLVIENALFFGAVLLMLLLFSGGYLVGARNQVRS